MPKFADSHATDRLQLGKGAQRQVAEYLLNNAQINYLITRCGLPAADHWCSLIADAFTKFGGKSRALSVP